MAEMYKLAVNSLESRGLHRYEVSNFAKPGFESIHNSWYWSGGEYLGVGPGAHGYFRIRNTDNPAAHEIAVDKVKGQIYPKALVEMEQPQTRIQTLEPENWLRETELMGHGTRKITPLNNEDVFERILASSMRTRKGLSVDVCRRFGITLENLINHEKCKEFLASNKLICDESCIRLSASGILLADYILPYLLLGIEGRISNLN